MKILKIEFLKREGDFANSSELELIIEQTENAILSVDWPEGSNSFTLYPVKKANGVVPIKKNCMNYLVKHGWITEHRIAIASRLKPGPIDAVKRLKNEQWFAVEWEIAAALTRTQIRHRATASRADCGLVAAHGLALSSAVSRSRSRTRPVYWALRISVAINAMTLTITSDQTINLIDPAPRGGS